MDDEEIRNRVWENASPVKGKNPNLYRKDSEGNEIFYQSYGKTSAKGWELDHVNPASKGGSDSVENLQALHWKANRKKSDKTNK